MRAFAVTLAVAVLLVGQARAEQPLSGTVTVRCPVDGASVFVDDLPVGVVPLAPLELRFGTHVITVKKEGLIAFEQSFRLSAGQQLVIDAVPAVPRALLTVDAGRITGEVQLDGKGLGALPMSGRSIAPGRHTLVVLAPGHEPYTETFIAPPHQEYIARPAFVTSVAQLATADASDDLELDLELDLAPVAEATPTPPVPEEDFASLPDLQVLTARDVTSTPVTTFVVDPVAREEALRQDEPSSPIYKQGWFWAATGVAVVAAVAIPVLATSTGGYQEVRDPAAACADCLAVLNR